MLGFIGLGIMGRPMAQNLLKAGHQLLVNDIDAQAVKFLEEKGAKPGTLQEIGSQCGIAFTIVPNGDVVKQVLFAENGLASSMKPGSLIVDMSSISPVESRYCAKKLEEMGIGFIDSPVSGGEPKAIDGTLAFMAGGKEADYNRALPYMQAMGASAMLVGGHGSGSVTKLVNQVIVNMNIATVAEAFVLAAKAGVDPEKVFQAIRGGLAGSTILDAKAPMMMERNFVPGGKISINHKDINNVLKTAHEMDVPMPFTSQLFEVMQALKVGGHMEEDHSAYVKYFEMLADVEVKKV